MSSSTPTQVARPWRSTLRTVFQGLLALALLLPIIASTIGVDPAVYPWAGGILAAAAAFTRLMAVPAVEEFLRKYVSFLAAEPPPPEKVVGPDDPAYNPQHDAGAADVVLILLVAIAIGVALLLVGVRF